MDISKIFENDVRYIRGTIDNEKLPEFDTIEQEAVDGYMLKRTAPFAPIYK